MEKADYAAAQAILTYVRDHSGHCTWYNIVRHIDQIGVQTTSLPYGVLKELVALGVVEADPNPATAKSTFTLTPQGLDYLASLASSSESN